MSMQSKSIVMRLKLHFEDGLFFCEIRQDDNDKVLFESFGYPHPRDAVYLALHGLAVENNFSGCLNLDLNNMGLKHD